MERLNIHILTLFPNIITDYTQYGIVRRAIERNHLELNVVNIRDFATDKHKTVDDTPYGGGAGMIMKPDVMAKSLTSVSFEHGKKKKQVILLSPQGRTFTQSVANELSMAGEFILICGRYRGIDERFCEKYVTDELSIGDYVLTGGEPAALVVIDAVTRLVPGVMNDFESGLEDSFQDDLLDCSWYTRPLDFEGMGVPEELLSGDHAKIKAWRTNDALQRTQRKRPDLLRNKRNN